MGRTLRLVLNGDIWREDYKRISDARVEFFAKKRDLEKDTAEYKQLVKISDKEDQVLEWAHLYIAPKKYRDSWFLCEQWCDEEDLAGKKTSLRLNPEPPAQKMLVSIPEQIAELREQNAKLMAAMEARGGGVATVAPPDPRIATLEAELADLRRKLEKKGGGA